MAHAVANGMPTAAVVRRQLAIVHQAIGWPGWAGLLLLAVAAWVGVVPLIRDGRHDGARTVQVGPASVSVAAPDASRAQGTGTSPVLKTRGDLPVLVTLMERAAIDSGLAWPSAEYRVTPATERTLQVLQVRLGFKAPYPKLRRMLVQLTETVPGLVFQEVSLTRPNAQQPDVDAKLRIDVLLDEVDPTQMMGDAARGGRP